MSTNERHEHRTAGRAWTRPIGWAWVGVVALVVAVCGDTLQATPVPGLYWTDQVAFGNDTIHRADLDGTGHSTLLSGLDQPRGITYNTADERLYFAQRNGNIRSVNTDGSGLTLLGDYAPNDSLRGIAADPVNGHLYWNSGQDPY